MKTKLLATLDTTLGTIVVRLFKKKAPETVANFVGLVKGEKAWRDPKSGATKENTPFYNGTIFHRVIPGFMIQGGDPLGTGTGGPGYRFKDEINPDLTFHKAGILAMANAGPNTNGSQFFITDAPTTHLNGHHTIFGEVTEGLDVVKAIARVKTVSLNRPLVPVVIKSIRVEEITVDAVETAAAPTIVMPVPAPVPTAIATPTVPSAAPTPNRGTEDL